MRVRGKVVKELEFLAINYVIGPSIGIFACLLEACGRIRFFNFERFPIWGEKLIIVSNHPSLLEPVVLPLMGFPWMNFPWVFSPVWGRFKLSMSWVKELQKEFSRQKTLIPANVPDKENFYDPPYLKVFQGINVPVDRNGGAHGRIGAINALRNILDSGGRVLIFPEGGRTFKVVQKTGNISNNGVQLGKLKDGAAWLALQTNARILPIWVEGTDKVLPNNKLPIPRLWHRISVRIGTPFTAQGGTRKEVTDHIAQALLELAGEKRA